MPTLTDNPGAAALLDKLREEFGIFVLLNCKTRPKEVIEIFLDLSRELETEPVDEGVLIALAEGFLGSATYWKPEQVAAELWTLREKILSEGEVERPDTPEEQAERAETIEAMMPLQLEAIASQEQDNPFLRPGLLDEPMSAKQVAELLGRSYGYVKDHGKDLHGHKNDKGAWEFYPRLLATVYDTHKKP